MTDLSIALTEEERARFYAKLRRAENGCLLWTACVSRTGRGYIKLKGSSEWAHRVAFVLSGRKITPEKPCVLHACDNPTCCEPTHLFAGTQLENIADRHNKNRNKKSKIGLARGVSKASCGPSRNRYLASIYLGSYLTPEEAEAAISEARRALVEYLHRSSDR